jgi:LemA protein
MTLLVILIIIIAILIIAVVFIYNKLVRLRNTVKSSWSDIDVQCKKRYDLVPNLVETVKGYGSHERTVFEKVTEARSVAMKATSPFTHSLNSVTSNLSSVMFSAPRSSGGGGGGFGGGGFSGGGFGGGGGSW